MKGLVAKLIWKGLVKLSSNNTIDKGAKWLMSKSARMSLKGNNKKLYDFYFKQSEQAGKVLKNNKPSSEAYKAASRTEEVALTKIENLFKDAMKGN
tara:strand:+ start:17 stop:304 length:288 start_codon:yes stop_codon:yes gene_type:complete